MGFKNFTEIFQGERKTVDYEQGAALGIRGDATSNTVVQHPVFSRPARDVAHSESAVHFLPQAAKCIVWAGFAVSSKLIPILGSLLFGSQCKPKAHFIAGDDKNSKLSSKILDLVSEWKVIAPTVIPHMISSIWFMLLARLYSRTFKISGGVEAMNQVDIFRGPQLYHRPLDFMVQVSRFAAEVPKINILPSIPIFLLPHLF
jgi:hypothetical protein